ncbi:MAG TPA: M1 family metallopeptidase [Polyangia bacterium]|nr:M1 family metallopeptidase [Polyangia bacterium]
MHALGMTLAVVSALRVPGPLSPRNANYQMKASLDVAEKSVTGHETLSWRNTASGPASELVFHLYMNAFKNELSTFLRESRGRLRRSDMEKHGWGAIDVKKIVVGGVDVTKRFTVDDTLGTLELDAPVAPGQTIQVEIDWVTKLPKVFARTGYHDDFFAVGQWFPKVGVWDCEGAGGCRWRAHQHHANSEFFADYGVYDVELDVPQKYWVGATGVYLDETAQGDRKVLRFHAEDVHDFVFTASPRFKVTEDTFTDALGSVKIEFLGIPGHESNAPRHIAATKLGLAELERRFGPYPYTQITVVDVPEGGEGAGGMEYPTLFFTFDVPVPRGLHLPELVTIHELSHQYFYGLVGSDEVEEAWLDEGFTETMTDWGLERMFGDGGVYRLFGHFLPDHEQSRLGYRAVADRDPMETRAFDFVSNNTYGAVTYGKTNVVMRTVEHLLGAPRFEQAMRHYYEQWRFRHPRMNDFVRSFDEGAGEDLTWFWTPALAGTGVLDYEVLSLDVREHRKPTGLFDDPGGARREVEPEKSEKPPFTSEVVVHRKGELVFPVELRVLFDDFSEKRETWDGGRADGKRWRRFTYEGPHKVVLAELDPDGKVPLDVSRWNNGRRAEEAPDLEPRRRLHGSFLELVSTLLATVGF